MAANTVSAPSFPCDRMPEDARAARLLGLYEQRQEGLFMQRIKALGGRMSPEQWRAVAELALQYTPGSPLHLTTRQDLEFHDLAPGNVPALQHGLHEAGLTGLGACGDTLRNITLCPGCGLHPGSFDLAPLAMAVRKHLESLAGIYSLPRKFKISMSGCARACARPWINDLGIVANDDGTFRAILGGSLGPRPGTGLLCYERLEAGEIVPLAAAALRLFEAEGDRENRSRARLRHVRERIGDERFRERLDALFREEKARSAACPPTPAPVRNDLPAPCLTQLHAPDGNLAADMILELLDALDSSSYVIQIGFEHDLFLFGIEMDRLPARLRALAGGPRVLACPGAHTCKRGLAKTWNVAAALREALREASDLVVAISGCPNNCCQSAIADVGLVARIKKVNGEPRIHYQLLARGGNGATPALAAEIQPGIPEERVPAVLRELLVEWRAAFPEGEVSFAAFVARDKERLPSELE